MSFKVLTYLLTAFNDYKTACGFLTFNVVLMLGYLLVTRRRPMYNIGCVVGLDNFDCYRGSTFVYKSSRGCRRVLSTHPCDASSDANDMRTHVFSPTSSNSVELIV